MSYSADFIAGWKAARTQYQHTGGVQPYPPELAKAPEPKTPAKAPEPKVSARKAAPRKKTGGE